MWPRITTAYTYYPKSVNHSMWGNVLLGGGLRSLSAFLLSEVIQHYSLTCMEERTNFDFIAVFWSSSCIRRWAAVVHMRTTEPSLNLNHFRHTSAATAMFYTGSSNSFPSVWRSSWPSTIKDWANDRVCSTWRWLKDPLKTASGAGLPHTFSCS